MTPPEGQRRVSSFAEACLNTAIGYVISIGAQALILPLFGLTLSLGQDCLMALYFTGISVVRSYVLRRIFNHLMVRGTG